MQPPALQLPLSTAAAAALTVPVPPLSWGWATSEPPKHSVPLEGTKGDLEDGLWWQRAQHRGHILGVQPQQFS